jgi:RNA polymerase sigma-70 factor, ECF subfamily
LTADTITKARMAEVVRASHGRLLALLSHRTRDILAAEDALAEAYAQALNVWPDRGIPDRPEAWLLTTARNRLIDHQRRAARYDVTDEVPDMPAEAASPDELPDRRLGLMFVCAHPAIDPAIHTPLMLQTVLGIEADLIGRAFAVPAATMAQRLVRAKRKIADARIRFEVPDRSVWPERLTSVREAIYGAFALGWDDETRDSDTLGSEAIYLASLLVDLTDRDPETLGLLAMMLLSESRAGARLKAGQMVPLPDQDPALWDKTLIDRGLVLLSEAAGKGQIGRFQLEAAIQSVHAARAATGKTDWMALAQLHFGLMRIAPTRGAAVGYAAAVANVAGAAEGLVALDKIGADLTGFQPAWALRAHLLVQVGQMQAAGEAYARAIAGATHEPQRRWLEQQAMQAKLKQT